VTRTSVALLAVDDAAYLPRVVGPLLADPRIELTAAILLPLAGAHAMHPGGARGRGAVAARVRLYGPGAFLGLAARQVLARLRRTAARTTLAGLARAHGARPVRFGGSVNDPALVERLAGSGAQVVLGVFSERAGPALRSAAPGGLILLHYSLLPRFAGREPAFWTLLEAPEAGGVTFFRASGELDRGEVAASAPCPLGGVRSLHRALGLLSDAAGGVAAEAACRAARGDLSPQVGPVEAPRPWPDAGAVARFGAGGGRFA
jgi:hypothetical protein